MRLLITYREFATNPRLIAHNITNYDKKSNSFVKCKNCSSQLIRLWKSSIMDVSNLFNTKWNFNKWVPDKFIPNKFWYNIILICREWICRIWICRGWIDEKPIKIPPCIKMLMKPYKLEISYASYSNSNSWSKIKDSQNKISITCTDPDNRRK